MGTGMVGQTIGSKLVQLGHRGKMGSRTARNPNAVAWAKASGAKAFHGTFDEAAAFGELLFNCTAGEASLNALRMAGEENLNGKILIDVANPLDFSKGMPPSLSVCNTDSLAEQIQRAFPEAKVVKTLNTVNSSLMVNPALLKGEHDIFVSGNDPETKAQVTAILKDWFAWQSVIDLGDITSARVQEMLLPIWLRLWGVWQTPIFNYKIVRQ